MGTNRFKAFPKIQQFRNIISSVNRRIRYVGVNSETEEPIYNYNIQLPRLKFKATTKLHGSNAGLIKIGNNYHCQSRQNCLNYPHMDNAEFGLMIHNLGSDVINNMFDTISDCDNISIYGEICGANIQRGVGITGLERMFVIFAIKVECDDGDKSIWLDISPELFKPFNQYNIYHIGQFPNSTYEVEIDFNNPELASIEFEKLTLVVEKECPVAKYFGVNGGIGEGLVWTCKEEGWSSSDFWFKTKGDKHSVSKVKRVASVNPEKVKNVIEFIENVVTENRLEQAFIATKELHNNIDLSPKQTGDFIRWIINDIFSEESDTMAANGLTDKCVNSKIANKAKNWFFNKL